MDRLRASGAGKRKRDVGPILMHAEAGGKRRRGESRLHTPLGPSPAYPAGSSPSEVSASRVESTSRSTDTFSAPSTITSRLDEEAENALLDEVEAEEEVEVALTVRVSNWYVMLAGVDVPVAADMTAYTDSHSDPPPPSSSSTLSSSSIEPEPSPPVALGPSTAEEATRCPEASDARPKYWRR
jgi:hypothetical protein